MKKFIGIFNTGGCEVELPISATCSESAMHTLRTLAKQCGQFSNLKIKES